RSLVDRELLSKLADTIEHETAVGEGTADPRDAWTQLAGRLPQSRSGAVFEYTQDTFAFGPTGTPADRAAAADPLVQSIRSELEHKARELAGHLSRISDPARLRGLLDAVRGFAQRVGGSEMEVAGDIGTLWVLGVALKAYVDSEKTDLSEQTFVPLEADLLRALRDLVGASGPWIRMFPTGCAFDDQTRSSG